MEHPSLGPEGLVTRGDAVGDVAPLFGNDFEALVAQFRAGLPQEAAGVVKSWKHALLISSTPQVVCPSD